MKEAVLRRHQSHPDQPPVKSDCTHGQFAQNFCRSPGASAAASEDSMSDRSEHLTPPESPRKASSPTAGATAERVGRLSLENDVYRREHQSCPRGRSMLSGSPTTASKRAASRELSPRPECQSERSRGATQPGPSPRNGNVTAKAQRRASGHRQCLAGARLSKGPDREKVAAHGSPALSKLRFKQRVDSGYGSIPSPRNTAQYPNSGWQNHAATLVPATVPETMVPASIQKAKGLTSRAVNSDYPGLLLQPDASPISLEQLAAEIKGIYAGLVMVEAKCMSIDKAQADDLKSHLDPEQWQALIALHRTLLYEHHDFLMATQHPSATEALRGLATKYSMPARMWRHGIHAFLEVLRHRRPASQDYMLSFIYLAYQMMALLLETVPSFTDTWIECLGDLARYRMAIEEEKEAHATWGGVAARWYTLASDRHPAIGRLYHHLGILERPSLRKLCYYAKSLTCVLPFPNAMDSLKTFCVPIVRDDRSIQSSIYSTEARIVTYYALNFSHGASDKTDNIGKHALELLSKQPLKIREIGAHLGITSISALFDFGEPSNALLNLYSTAVEQAKQPSGTTPLDNECNLSSLCSRNTSPALSSCNRFLFSTFDLVVRRLHLLVQVRDCLPYVHMMLVWLHSLHELHTRLDISTQSLQLDIGLLNWQGLARLLNCVAQEYPIAPRVSECAREKKFVIPEIKGVPARPLPEDDLVRGLVWGQFYFPPGWFDDQTEDDGRSIEDKYTYEARAERVLWLGMYLALHTDYLHYDVETHLFAAGSSACKQSCAPVAPTMEGSQGSPKTYADTRSHPDEPVHGSELGVSSSETSEDGYAIIKGPRAATSGRSRHSPKPLRSPRVSSGVAKSKPCSRTTSAARKGQYLSPAANNFRVVGTDEGMDWTLGEVE
ncbi:unnamed protein product [Zymoseptoria tritici ST99CH_3D1]|nr:unnamed protein product [Zymoseptoria tritici ST99CH_3D1]